MRVRIYTDDSKTENGSGAGVYLWNKSEKWAFPLGQYRTVFQAEVYAILKAATWMIDERLKGRRIAISSDSQAALRALTNILITSKIIQECRNRLKSVSRFNTADLPWVPGHCGVEGNEISDALAKEASTFSMPALEPAIGVSVALADAAIKNWEQAILTGHNSLAGHIFRIGIIQDDTCPSCNEEAESREHFLYECPAYGRIRHQIFGVDVLQLQRIASHPLTEILRYVNESGILLRCIVFFWLIACNRLGGEFARFSVANLEILPEEQFINHFCLKYICPGGQKVA